MVTWQPSNFSTEPLPSSLRWSGEPFTVALNCSVFGRVHHSSLTFKLPQMNSSLPLYLHLVFFQASLDVADDHCHPKTTSRLLCHSSLSVLLLFINECLTHTLALSTLMLITLPCTSKRHLKQPFNKSFLTHKNAL